MSTCPNCRQPVKWVSLQTTDGRRRVAVNVDPEPTSGTVELVGSHTTQPTLTYNAVELGPLEIQIALVERRPLHEIHDCVTAAPVHRAAAA